MKIQLTLTGDADKPIPPESVEALEKAIQFHARAYGLQGMIVRDETAIDSENYKLCWENEKLRLAVGQRESARRVAESRLRWVLACLNSWNAFSEFVGEFLGIDGMESTTATDAEWIAVIDQGKEQNQNV